MISVSIASTSVDKIGRSTYLGIVNEAINRILPAASATRHVALNTFGGGGSAVSDTNSIYTLGNHGFTSGLSTSILNLETSADWDSNVANDVAAALVAGNSVLNSGVGQKYHLVFTAGNPLQHGFGDGTDPSHPSNPCQAAVAAKQAGIQTYMVLIGVQGVNFVKEFYTCVGELGEEDIIVINPSSPSYTTLTTKLCKTNGIDLKITEFNPNAGAQFIEIFNRGAPTNINACFGTTSGTCAASGSVVGTGAYFVASEGGYISSGNANGAVTASLSTRSFPVSGVYDVNAYVTGSTSPSDTLAYNTGNSLHFQDAFATRSLELRAIGFNNDYGANWRLSCYTGNAIAGTPGVAAEDCGLVSLSCSDGEGSATLTATALCNNNGGGSLQCNNLGELCGCSVGLYTDVDTCTSMPEPTSYCRGYVLSDPLGNGDDWLHLIWDSVEFDDEVTYTITWTDAQGTLQSASRRGYPVYATKDFFVNYGLSGVTPPGIEVIAGYDIMGTGSDDESDKLTVASCTVTTLQPTKAPTVQPTADPTRAPTSIPTLAPTFEQPGAYVRSACSKDRCNCFEQAKYCCTPFGPLYPDMSTGEIPTEGCEHLTSRVFVGEAEQFDKKEEIEFSVYPEGYPNTVRISYLVKAFGQINDTDFESLSWADTYLADGVVDSSVTTRRRTLQQRLEQEYAMQQQQRHLLQTNTPAPTTLYGNRLNIEVLPPGEDTLYAGAITVAGGEVSAAFTLNISAATLKCNQGDDCPTLDECQTTGLGYVVVLTDCEVPGSTTEVCDLIYPNVHWLMVTRDNALCGIIFGAVGGDDELPDWFWWVLIALLVFLLCLAWLIYRFWWRQKKKAGELGDAQDELQQQQADNQQGFGKDLDVGDVAFNPMATGVPGMNRPADAFGNEIHQRQIHQQNEMVDVQAEVFQVREDYGQVATGNRHHQ
eukprot:CAMPEP_0202733248 /NCGR_PEP_ID=MMETSP1385-20130828/188069_1 /ASSEMBLY_ACC=CAM_ASM_000861 /TAXON_ID=933848 /ORGANISM="Elphidium margaritaceum" /LENGTH=932 /DNA_ID=CAMNT_0049399577 /DNA_START=237 /DNA_END=3035 /DNA_ORIENTATION=+